MPAVPADLPPVPVSVVAPGIPRPPVSESSYYSLARPAVEPTASDARSLLSRLGVEVRGSGGRRRAADPAETDPSYSDFSNSDPSGSDSSNTDVSAAGLPAAAPPVGDPAPAAPPGVEAELPPGRPISLPNMDWLSELSLGPRSVAPEPTQYERLPVEPPQYEPRPPIEPRELAPAPPPALPPMPPLPALTPPPIMPAQPLFHFDPEPATDPEPAPQRPPESNGVGGKHSNRLGDLLMEALLAYRTASEPDPEPEPEPVPELPRHSAIARELDDDRDTAPRWLPPRWDS
jgi:hypothetical protein